MMAPFRIRFAIAFAALAAGLATAAPAHPHLVAATPAPDAIVARPARLELHFSERLVPRFCHVEVLPAGGGALPMASSVAGDGMALILTPRAPLAPGLYRVNWHAVSVDTHHLDGSYAFRVR
jgi:methionine-rich copper-binding protein CopC